MTKLSDSHNHFKYIKKLFLPGKFENDSIDFLKAVIKAYTSEAVFLKIG
jgi:hypothetical protein